MFNMRNNIGKNSIDENMKKEYEKKIEKLAFDLDAVEDEKLEIQNQLKKALSDYHNLSANIAKREELRFFQLKRGLCEEMIPSLDTISLALKSSEEVSLNEKGRAWLEGITNTLESIKKIFEGLGLTQYLPKKGDTFDSSIHEAIATVDGGEKGKIFDIVQPGYVLNDIVIRQAKVVVSK